MFYRAKLLRVAIRNKYATFDLENYINLNVVNNMCNTVI